MKEAQLSQFEQDDALARKAGMGIGGLINVLEARGICYQAINNSNESVQENRNPPANRQPRHTVTQQPVTLPPVIQRRAIVAQQNSVLPQQAAALPPPVPPRRINVGQQNTVDPAPENINHELNNATPLTTIKVLKDDANRLASLGIFDLPTAPHNSSTQVSVHCSSTTRSEVKVEVIFNSGAEALAAALRL